MPLGIGPQLWARISLVLRHMCGICLCICAIGSFYWQIRIISAAPMDISWATDTVQLCFIIGIFRWLLPDTISYKHCCSMGFYSNSCFKNQPRTMSSDTGASILNEGLACIGQRIASILIQPANKDNHYITSLHNKVVSIFYSFKSVWIPVN